MTRDDALFIARRVMDRNREDGAEHLDSIADEIIAGVAIIEGRPSKVMVAVDGTLTEVSECKIGVPYIIGNSIAIWSSSTAPESEFLPRIVNCQEKREREVLALLKKKYES